MSPTIPALSCQAELAVISYGPVVAKRAAVVPSTAAVASLPLADAAAAIVIATEAMRSSMPSGSLVAPGGVARSTRPIDSHVPACTPIAVPAATSRARKPKIAATS